MKLQIKPNLWGVGLDILEIDLSSISNLFYNETNLPKEIYDDRMINLIDNTLNVIAKDRYSEGSSAGGWGKDYWDRYYDDMYPNGLPSDLRKNPDSITWTAVVLDSLRCISDSSSVTNDKFSKDFFDKIFSGTRSYLASRFSDGEAGLRVSTAGGEHIVAKNLRHTATSSFAWFRLKGDEGKFIKLISNIIKKLIGGYPYSKERGVSVACILGSLYLAKYSNHRESINLSDKELDQIISEAELALYKRYNFEYSFWDISSNSKNRQCIWYSLWILKFAFALSESNNPKILNMYNSAIEKLIKLLVKMPDGSKGIPLFLDGQPDIGSTCILLELIRFSPIKNDRKIKRIIKNIYYFIIKHGNDKKYLVNTYSWTRANLITALIAKKQWGLKK